MGVVKSTFYYKTEDKDERIESDLELRDEIEKIHVDLPGYGYRRIREDLLKRGKRVNSKRIRRVMKEYSLHSCIRKLMKPRGTHTPVKLYYPNLIRGYQINGPNQVWATDLTYIRLMNEYVYLNAIIDVYTRKIIGWSLSRDLSHKFCLMALDIAIEACGPPKGCLHHSDRGVQYTCEKYISRLLEYGFEVSQSRLATPQDNAYIESFFKTLKKEEVYFKKYKTMADIKNNLPQFIDEIYSKKRLHSSLGYKTPEEFESEVLNMKPASRPVQKLWGWKV